MTPHVTVRDEGAVRIIRIERPDKKNALTSIMYDALAAGLAGTKTSPHIHSVLITGVPGAFCAGNDMEEFRQAAESGEGLSESVIRFLYALAACERPIIAAVNGLAIGVGTTMLLHCDYVVASREARFSTPFVNLGLVPEAASSLIAPRLMGQRRAFALLVMGEPLDAQGALAAGLVNMIVDGADVEPRALEAAQKIATLPPEAVLASRRLMRGSTEEIVERIDEEADNFLERLQSPEAMAAFKAFFKRKK
jgi:enoyl-CoA hydratase/carnithine racemase